MRARYGDDLVASRLHFAPSHGSLFRRIVQGKDLDAPFRPRVDRVYRVCAHGGALAAQQNATVQGTVVDESQAVLPGATVTATEISTGVQSVAVAEADGRYRFDNLAPGRLQAPDRALRVRDRRDHRRRAARRPERHRAARRR